jgi:hypothetical protein
VGGGRKARQGGEGGWTEVCCERGCGRGEIEGERPGICLPDQKAGREVSLKRVLGGGGV